MAGLREAEGELLSLEEETRVGDPGPVVGRSTDGATAAGFGWGPDGVMITNGGAAAPDRNVIVWNSPDPTVHVIESPTSTLSWRGRNELA